MTTQEIEKGFQEIWALYRETDKKFQETNEKWQETDKKWQETDKRFQATDKKWQETDKRFQETDRKLARTEGLVNKLTGKWGRFVEGLIVPAVERLFEERNIIIDKVYQRVKAHKNGGGMEVDILAIDSEYAVLIEAKSTLTVDDVNDHLERLANFKMFFPEYKEKKTFGAVAGIVIDENADRYAYKKGLFVIGQHGETVKILNDKKFQPQVW